MYTLLHNLGYTIIAVSFLGMLILEADEYYRARKALAVEGAQEPTLPGE